MKMKMKKFKLHTGISEIYRISTETYEKAVANNPNYIYTGRDNVKRYFAVCPACDNPIQLIGLYKKLENTDRPYGRHYNRDTKIAKHNEQAYRFCPYASHSYGVTKKSIKDEMTEYEENIYNGVRENFDLAVYIMKQDTGILFSKKFLVEILRGYLSAEAYMYYWATPYNIPWMLLYFMGEIPCYGLRVKKECELWDYLSSRTDVKFIRSGVDGYDQVINNGKFLNLYLTFLFHKRQVIDDEVKETLSLVLTSRKKNGDSQRVHEIILDINEYRFPNLACSAKYRDQTLLDLAKEVLPNLSISNW